MSGLVARYNRGDDSIRVYQAFADNRPGGYIAVRDEGITQTVEPLNSLVMALYWMLEGYRPVALCGDCGGHGWKWVPAGNGEADRDICPVCEGQGGRP